jgi:multiple antibiotic resistance protein
MFAELTSLALLLLILMDPLGNIPIILTRLKSLPAARRRFIILRESLIAGFVLILFVFMGDWILSTLRLSEIAIQIAGGLILFLIALSMVFPNHTYGADDTDPTQEPFIVPIAIPMLAGPAALATVLLNARQTEHIAVLIGAIIVATFFNTLILMTSQGMARLLGKAGMTALERLMGLALTAIAVQMLLNGIKAAIESPGSI